MNPQLSAPRLLCHLFLLSIAVRCYDRPEGLYQPGDDVVLLNDTNFHSTISGREHAWLVEFYASWCGYCRGFAPVFKRFAKEVANWADVIKVAVIDCGDRINAETVCKSANLSGYPTIKYYLPFAEKGDQGFNRVSQDHSGEGLLIDTINFVDQMIEEMVELNPNITDLWPSLGPLVAHNFSVLDQADLWPDKAEFTFVVIEQQRSFIGRQIILDFWRRNSSHIVVRRLPVDETAEHVVQFLEKLNISILPTVAVLNSQDQTVNILQSRNNEKSSLEKSIVDFIARKSLRTLPADGRLSSLSPAESTQQQDFIAEDDDIIRRRYTLYLNDLDKTVIFALNQEISLKQHLSDLEEKSLREFINILVKFYPSESEVYPKIIQIQNWLEQSEPHKVDLQRMSEIMESVADFAPHWLGCRGSQQTFGGYSCGVWSLWHFLTVAQLEAGQGQPRDVLRAMVSYLRHFFGCRECSDHFLQMVKNGTEIEREVTNYEEAVLFLWRKHNEVNLRLSGDASDDPVFPKGYFPSKRFCRECYEGDTEEETSSQRENIISFIKKHYSQHSLIRGGHFSTSFSLVSTLHNLLYIVEIIPLFFI